MGESALAMPCPSGGAPRVSAIAAAHGAGSPHGSQRAAALASAVARRTGLPCMLSYALPGGADPDQAVRAEAAAVTWACESQLAQ